MNLKLIFAIITLALSLMIALVNKYRPHYLLKLPNGYILWMALGNPVPPMYDRSPFHVDNFGKWTKDNDVIIASGTKCGTNWLLYCSHQIRTKGKGYFIDPGVETPWIGLRHKPGQTWEELDVLMHNAVLKDGTKLKDRWDSPDYPFRIFKSHYPPYNGREFTEDSVLPVRQFRNVKFIAMSRNGLDVIESFHRFTKGLHPDFEREVNGVTPMDYTLDQIFEGFLPGGIFQSVYLGYTKAWWDFRNDENVLLLHYNDMKYDLRAGIKKIANFLGVKLTQDETDVIEWQCGLEHMRTMKANFTGILWGNPRLESVLCNGKPPCKDHAKLVSSGRIGGGKEMLKPEQIAQWNDASSSYFLDPALHSWAESGGGFV